MRALSTTLVLLLLVSRAGAQESVVTATSTAVGEYRTRSGNRVEPGGYQVVLDRLTLGLTDGALTTSLRIDGVRFLQTEYPRYRNDLRLERFLLQYDRARWVLVAGDTFQQLGRGIALSLRKVDEVGRDVSLQGGELQYRGDSLRAGLFAGRVNPTNLDPVSQFHVPDPGDALVGGSTQGMPLDGATLGLHAVYLDPRRDLLPQRVVAEPDYAATVGGSIELADLVPWAAVYAEGDVQQRRLGGKTSPGYAAYATLDAFTDDVVALVEGIWLSGFEMRGSPDPSVGSRFIYNQPPTLQRMQEEVLTNRDVLGSRLRLQADLAAVNLVVFANGLLRFEDYAESSRIRQLHAWAGIEWSPSDGLGRLNVQVGHRQEEQNGARLKSLQHVELDYLQPLFSAVALHLASDTELRRRPGNRWVRGTTSLGVERAGLGAVTFELGYDTERWAADNPPRRPLDRALYFAGIIVAKPSSDIEVSATMGSERGGLKCIAGVCREFPPFRGVRLQLVLRT